MNGDTSARVGAPLRLAAPQEERIGAREDGCGQSVRADHDDECGTCAIGVSAP
jgi:hypothetical protein